VDTGGSGRRVDANCGYSEFIIRIGNTGNRNSANSNLEMALVLMFSAKPEHSCMFGHRPLDGVEIAPEEFHGERSCSYPLRPRSPTGANQAPIRYRGKSLRTREHGNSRFLPRDFEFNCGDNCPDYCPRNFVMLGNRDVIDMGIVDTDIASGGHYDSHSAGRMSCMVIIRVGLAR